MLCMLKKKTYILLVFQNNSNHEKQVVNLMIPNGEKWHYPVVKKLSPLSRILDCKDNGDFYCLNCFHFLGTEKKLECIKTYVKIKIKLECIKTYVKIKIFVM